MLELTCCINIGQGQGQGQGQGWGAMLYHAATRENLYIISVPKFIAYLYCICLSLPQIYT